MGTSTGNFRFKSHEAADLWLRATTPSVQNPIIRELDGVPIPFTSPRLLQRMKGKPHLLKDRADFQSLREISAEEIFGKSDPTKFSPPPSVRYREIHFVAIPAF